MIDLHAQICMEAMSNVYHINNISVEKKTFKVSFTYDFQSIKIHETFGQSIQCIKQSLQTKKNNIIVKPINPLLQSESKMLNNADIY